MDDKSAKFFLAYVLSRDHTPENTEPRDLSIIRSLVHAAGVGTEYDFAYMSKFYELPELFEGPDNLVTPDAGIGYVVWQLALFAHRAVVSADMRSRAEPERKAKLDSAVSGILDQCFEVTEALGWRADYIGEYQKLNSGTVPTSAVDAYIRNLLEGKE